MVPLEYILCFLSHLGERKFHSNYLIYESSDQSSLLDSYGNHWNYPYTSGVALLNPCNSAPLLKMQQLVVIQDAAVYAVPHTYSVVFRAWYKLCYRYVTATRKDGEEFDNRVTLLAFRASSLLWLR